MEVWVQDLTKGLLLRQLTKQKKNQQKLTATEQVNDIKMDYTYKIT